MNRLPAGVLSFFADLFYGSGSHDVSGTPDQATDVMSCKFTYKATYKAVATLVAVLSEKKKGLERYAAQGLQE